MATIVLFYPTVVRLCLMVDRGLKGGVDPNVPRFARGFQVKTDSQQLMEPVKYCTCRPSVILYWLFIIRGTCVQIVI